MCACVRACVRACVYELYLFSSLIAQQKEYEIDFETKKCTTKELTTPFKPFGVDSTAKFVDTLTIGLEKSTTMGLLLNVFSVENPKSKKF